MKIFLNFTYLHKTQPGQKAAGNFLNFFKTTTHQFCYPELDAFLNISRFGGDIAFPSKRSAKACQASFTPLQIR